MQPASAAQWWHHFEVEAAAEQGLEGAQTRQGWLVCTARALWLHLAVIPCKVCAVCKVSSNHSRFAAAQGKLMCVLAACLLVTPCWLLQHRPHLL